MDRSVRSESTNLMNKQELIKHLLESGHRERPSSLSEVRDLMGRLSILGQRKADCVSGKCKGQSQVDLRAHSRHGGGDTDSRGQEWVFIQGGRWMVDQLRLLDDVFISYITSSTDSVTYTLDNYCLWKLQV